MSQKVKLDPRVKRSREWMKSALLELVQEKPYEKISITNITDRAGLSRPTFYLHYKSKDELLMDHLDTVFDPVMDAYYELKENANVQQPGVLAMTKMFEEIAKNIDVFRTALQAGAEQLLIKRMYFRNIDYLKCLAQRCEVEISPKVLHLTSHYMAGAFIGIFLDWLEDPNPAPPEQMGTYVSKATIGLLRVAICNGELNGIFD
jgi:AcrR family transcriptional regulator